MRRSGKPRPEGPPRRVTFETLHSELEFRPGGESSRHGRPAHFRVRSGLARSDAGSYHASDRSDYEESQIGLNHVTDDSASGSGRYDFEYTPFRTGESTLTDEPDLLDSRRRHLPDISHWVPYVHGLRYGEEPISVLDDVGPLEYKSVLEGNHLPQTASRERESHHLMTDEAIDHRLKLLNKIHSPSWIRDGLYIANYETACYYLSGEGNRNKHYPKIGYVLSIINFRSEDNYKYKALKPANPEEFPEGCLLWLNVRDSTRVNFMELFPLIISFIVHSIDAGGLDQGRGRGVLVHCRKGMSRSVAAVMAYLTWLDNKSVIEIWRQIVTLRPVAWPNAEFYTQLCMWRMWNFDLTDEDGKEKDQYTEYVIEKGLESAVMGVKADLTAHMGLNAPKKWPVEFLDPSRTAFLSGASGLPRVSTPGLQ